MYRRIHLQFEPRPAGPYKGVHATRKGAQTRAPAQMSIVGAHVCLSVNRLMLEQLLKASRLVL